MLCIYHEDERERAQALLSIARRCEQLDVRLAFLGLAATCEATREAVRRIEAAPLPCLSFRSVDLSATGSTMTGEQACNGAIEVLRATLPEASAAGGGLVAWVELPLPRDGVTASKALVAAYREALESLAQGTAATVISAFPLADLAERPLLRALLEGANTLISAKTIVPGCPSWLIRRTSADPAPVASSPAYTAVAPFTESFQAEKLAALVQLAAGVAHELGNPLSIISSSLQYLHNQHVTANDPASDFTMMALQNVDRMQGLLRRMLDFASTKKTHLEEVDLKEIVTDVVRFISPECNRRGISLPVSFDASLPKVRVDSCGLRQILLNLVVNALEAMSEHGDTLRICTRMASSDMAVIVVEDNGPPIPAAVLANLFRPFHTTKERGTGLGLYLSQQIARDHDGGIEAENLGATVRFTVTLRVGR